MNQDPSARLRLEAHALRHVLALPVEDRADAAERLNGCALALVATVGAVFRQLAETPSIDPTDVAQMLDQRPALRADVDALDAAGLSSWASRPLDPADARAAFDACLADAAATGTARRIEAAERLLADARTAPTEQARRDMLADAARVLERQALVKDGTPSGLWAAYLASKAGERVGPQKAVMLDKATRGEWANWFNCHLGPRGGLEPGRTMIAGGSPGAGKTSLGAVLAVDAMAAGCPVLFWQLELSREETLEHLAAQLPQAGPWWKAPYWTRARALSLPDSWDNLLTVPRWPAPEAEDLLAAIERMARQADRARRAGTLAHACNGLAVVDYVQLLTLRDRKARDAGHEVLTTAVSRLAKGAAERGVCLVLLSQLNKAERKEGPLGDTALAGADLARMAHCAAFIQKAKRDGAVWKACGSTESPDLDPSNGEARLVEWAKTRGVYWVDQRRPEKALGIWCHNRALHDGTLPKTAGREGL